VVRLFVATCALVALLGLTACGGDEEAVAQDPVCGPVGELARDLGLERTRELVLCLLNAERAKHGFAPLRREERLELASQGHSEDMVARKFFEHETPEGVDPQERIFETGYPANNAITGENIAWGTGPDGSPAGIVELWMHSPPHRENILRPEFAEIGIGVAAGAPAKPTSTDPPATYATDFGGPPVR